MENKKKMSYSMKIGLMIIISGFIITAATLVTFISTSICESQTDVSNKAVDEFLVKQTQSIPKVEDSVIQETVADVVPTAVVESTQSPAEIGATYEVTPEDLIEHEGITEEEVQVVIEEALVKAPQAVQPFRVIKFSNDGIAFYDANGDYYEWE